MADAALSRLEAVTARLEALESKLASGGGPGYQSSRSVAASSYSSAPRGTAGASSAGGATGGPVDGLKQLIAETVQPFTASAAPLSPGVQNVTSIVKKAFDALQSVLSISLEARKPDQTELSTLLQPLSEQLSAASSLTEGKRTDDFNHYKTVAEALQAMCFVLYTDPSCGMMAPAEHVAQSWQTAEFYANKISVQYKHSNPDHVEWVKKLKTCFLQLRTFVQHQFPQGLSWKAGGLSVADAKKAVQSGAGAGPVTAAGAGAADGSAAASSTPAASPAPASSGNAGAAVSAGAAAPATSAASPAPMSSVAAKPAAPPAPPAGGLPPPPPPPPPPPAGFSKPDAPSSGTSHPAGGMADVFASLNQGEAVTSGLKKVTDDMKVKNRADRTGVVRSDPAAKPAPVKASKTKGGPPRLELETASRKWAVEHHENNKELVISEGNPQQTVYIYDCHDCVVQVQGKVNSVAVDGCSKTGVVLTDVVAQVEAVNCNSIQIQCTGSVPTISVEKVDGCQLYVSEACSKNPDFQLVTAKSSAMNIVVLTEVEEPAEVPVPEQFISKFKDGKLVTLAASHAGA